MSEYHYTNGKEFLSIDNENMMYTLEKICPSEDYELLQNTDFVAVRRNLFRNDNYRQRWVLPKKSGSVDIIDDDGFRIPKQNLRNSRLRHRTCKLA